VVRVESIERRKSTMMSNLGRHAPRNLDEELARAYEGEVPIPYYWQASVEPPRTGARHHPGELEATLPYAVLPAEMLFAPAVSIDELDELVERRARREEHGG
jgi:hypothetical protein